MALLFGTSWTLTALPGPEDYKKTVEDVKKASAIPTPPSGAPGFRGEADKPAAASNASPSATAGHVLFSSNASPAPTPWDNRYKSGSQTGSREPLPTNFSDRYDQTSKPTSKPTSDTEDWHKKNKKNMQKHHDDDRYSVNFGPTNSSEPTASWKKGKKHWNKNSEGATGSSFDNNTYDGSPVHYNKPKPTSDTEDWHKKNKNEHHHHDGDWRENNAKPQGQGWLYLDLPKDGTAKKKHQNQGND